VKLTEVITVIKLYCTVIAKLFSIVSFKKRLHISFKSVDI